MPEALSILLALIAGLGLLLHIGSALLAAQRYLRRPPEHENPEQKDWPLITVIRPVCGVDTFDAETLESTFAQDYPRFEILFCAAHERDPAVPLVRRLIKAHPGVTARLMIGEQSLTANPKLNNMFKAYVAARGDWLAMIDANLLIPRDYLRQLMTTWDGQTGLVSAPPAGNRPGNLWGALECAFLNGNQARWQLAADSLGLGFAQGKTLFWNRSALRAGGGLCALGRNLAEDVAATKLVRGQSLRVRLTRRLAFQPVGLRDAASVWARQLRWSRVRRDGFPLLFAVEIAQGPLLPLAALAGLCGAGALPALALPGFALIWYGCEYLLARTAGWPAGLRDLAVMPLRDLWLPALWVATWTGRGITWRGKDLTPAPAGGAE